MKKVEDAPEKVVDKQEVAGDSDTSQFDREEPGNRGKNMPQLVQVDLNLDTLRTFLEEI